MPLLPPGAIFHSTVSSKFSYSPSETMSPPRPTRVRAPSTTFHPSGSVFCPYPRQPAVVLPSKSAFPPSPRCGFGVVPPAGAGAWLKPANTVQASTSAMEVGRFMPPSLFSWSRLTQNIMATYLGFDSSTQSLTATVIDINGSDRRIVFEHVLEFDSAFPEYGTTHGVLVSGDEGRVVTAPPAMWAAALDRMAGILASSGVDLSQIRAVTGSGQQHGSVYLSADAAAGLRGLDPARPLSDQIGACFSRRVSPVWMDSSTTAECASLTTSMGGDAALARLTGSR